MRELSKEEKRPTYRVLGWILGIRLLTTMVQQGYAPLKHIIMEKLMASNKLRDLNMRQDSTLCFFYRRRTLKFFS
jgi:hypothetical protein